MNPDLIKEAEELEGLVEGVTCTPWISRPDQGPPFYVRYQIGGPNEGVWITRAHIAVFAREGVFKWTVTSTSKVVRKLSLSDLSAQEGTSRRLETAQMCCDEHLLAPSEFIRIYHKEAPFQMNR